MLNYKKPTEEQKETIISALERLNMPYFKPRNKDGLKKIQWEGSKLIITFCLPRNSLFSIVEFCKINDICIAYDNGKIRLEFYHGYKKDYDFFGA